MISSEPLDDEDEEAANDAPKERPKDAAVRPRALTLLEGALALIQVGKWTASPENQHDPMTALLHARWRSFRSRKGGFWPTWMAMGYLVTAEPRLTSLPRALPLRAPTAALGTTIIQAAIAACARDIEADKAAKRRPMPEAAR